MPGLADEMVRYLTEIDDCQGRGSARCWSRSPALVLAPKASLRSALMLAPNEEMMELLKRLDPVRIIDRELFTVEIELPIPDIGLAPALEQLLQIAGRHDVVLPLAGLDGPCARRRTCTLSSVLGERRRLA